MIYTHGTVPSTITIEAAWALFQGDASLVERYEAYAGSSELSPLWACWFARFVLFNLWPAAEEFIRTDDIARQRYATNSIVWKCVARRPELARYKTDEYGRIVEWERKPVSALEKRMSLRELEAVADRIAGEMDEFRLQRDLEADLNDE